jgi:hypothetical protein
MSQIYGNKVQTVDVEDSAVTTTKINNSAVTTAKINNSAVTTAKLDGDAVNLAKTKAGATGSNLYLRLQPANLAYGTSTIAKLVGRFVFLKAGSVSLTWEQRMAIASGSCEVYVYAGSSSPTTYVESSSSFVTKSMNITFGGVGGVVDVAIRRSGLPSSSTVNAEIRNLRILMNDPTVAVLPLYGRGYFVD